MAPNEKQQQRQHHLQILQEYQTLKMAIKTFDKKA
jgi:hypothetical protein